MTKKQKLYRFNDPIYGFIRIRHPFLLELINDPYFQRLRRISQMGMSSLVFPGAQHTRFEHAMGAMHLMAKAMSVLRLKGTEISLEEEKGLLGAILLHDIGHGPFSHALEKVLVSNYSHEEITLKLMHSLNEKYGGVLQTAIEIFKGTYPKEFLNQLVASQLDMDRLDYLKRDSFYTGVSEGNINSDRLISMLDVIGKTLVVEEKGVFSVEKYLMARRFMYWQVYLHKTGFVAEELLVKIIRRAKEVVRSGVELPMSDSLRYFIAADNEFTQESEWAFSQLDDVDVTYAIKSWQNCSDKVLASLSKMLIQRRLLKVKIQTQPFSKSAIETKEKKAMELLGVNEDQVGYFVFTGTIKNLAYNSTKQPIAISGANREKRSFESSDDQSFLSSLSRADEKHYLCYPKSTGV